MTELTRPRETGVAERFRWITGRGERVRPVDMDTSHLFNAVVMIWNHSMPPNAATHDYRRYRFSPAYSVEYMADAVRFMMPELLDRTDLTERQRVTLHRMYDYLVRFRPHEARMIEERRLLR